MWPVFAGAQESAWDEARLMEFAAASCRGWDATGEPAPGYSDDEIGVSDLRFGEMVIGKRYRLPLEHGGLVELGVVVRDQRPVRFVASLFHDTGDPLALVSLDADCDLQVARRLNYTTRGRALDIVSLDRDLQPVGEPDWLNPPLQFVARPARAQDEKPVRVALVDSGVNYRLDEINRRLARDERGHLVGYDFWEMDGLPYDSHPVNSGFFVQRHGTRTASLLLREAPQVEFVPYRYPRPEMVRMQALVEHAEANGVAIVGMPLGSNRAEDWGAFARAAQAHPHILFVVSAGNNGRDIDTQPVFPAALDLDNILVVTSADDFVRPAERSNWGRVSVDFMVPAERQVALDYPGNETLVSGSSYAVSRVVALAARLKAANPDWVATDIIEELNRRYGGEVPDVGGWVSSGYIGDPLAPEPVSKVPLADFDLQPEVREGGFRLDLEVLQLDPRWSGERIAEALGEAYRILAQCGIVADELSVFTIDAADHRRDLSTGSARGLLESAGAIQPTVVFARDTRMEHAYLGEAFGYGNTLRRPWMVNSVWLMLDVDDPGIALAHELYHVLANNGDHVVGLANLMQADTRPDSTELTPAQCDLAQVTGVANGLLHEN